MNDKIIRKFDFPVPEELKGVELNNSFHQGLTITGDEKLYEQPYYEWLSGNY